MAPDGNSSTMCSFELNPNGPSLHEVEGSKHAVPAGKNGVEGSKHAVPAGKNGVSKIPRRSFEGHVHRTVSDVSSQLRRSSMNSDVNLHSVKNLEVEKAQCECCGMSEEYTPSYICRVRELYCGRWVCGLCAEAVNEERHRMGRVAMEDALRAHMAVCVKFNKVALSNPAMYLADAMCELLKKSSQANGLRSKLNSPRDRVVTKKTISRSTSCIPAIVRK